MPGLFSRMDAVDLSEDQVRAVASKQAVYLGTLRAEVLKAGISEDQALELLKTVAAGCANGAMTEGLDIGQVVRR